MNPIGLGWLEAGFRSVIHATWQGAVLALIVLALARCLGERVRANWRFTLWLVVFARLAMPWVPAAPWSIYALLPKFEKQNAEVPAVAVSPFRALPDPPSVPPLSSQVDSPDAGGHDPAPGPESTVTRRGPGDGSRWIDRSAWLTRLSLLQWLTIGWLAGVVLMAGRIIWLHVRLARCRAFWRPLADPVLSALFEQCRAEARVRRPVKMHLASGDVGPATYGVTAPSIVVPERLTTLLAHDELRLVLKAQVEKRQKMVNRAARNDGRIEPIFDDMPTDEHHRLLASVDGFLAPSRWEGLGLHLYEAAAFGVPVITNDNPPMNEVVVDGENGLLVPGVPAEEASPSGIPSWDPDVGALTAAIERIADPGVRAELAEGAARARERLSWDNTLADLRTLLASESRR
jgi:beta-lactamase regulating signal transducer with metallopeptidase domain